MVREALQQAEIRRSAAEGPPAVFVCGMGTIADRSAPAGFITCATWSVVGGWLPSNTSHVVVQHPGSTVASLIDRDRIDALWIAHSDPVPGTFGMADHLVSSFPAAHTGARGEVD